MSRIDELIAAQCPDGVKYRRLGDVTVQRRGKGLKKDDKGTGETAVILYGELYTTYGDYITSVYSRCDRQTALKALPVSYGDVLLPISSTTRKAQIGKASVLKVSEPVYMGGDAVALTPKDCILSDYLMYCLNGQAFEEQKMKCVKGTTIQHLNPLMLYDILIPVPPLAVQREVVRVLDTFTGLTAELTAELTARRKQYEYYRDEILTGSMLPHENVRLMSIGELITFSSLRQKHITEQAPVYSVSNTRGLLPLSEYRMEGTSAHASKDTSNYSVVRKDCFAYNPARLNVGSIAKMNDDIGIVSPMYKVFTVKDENVILPEYLRLLLDTCHVHFFIEKYKEVGARFKFNPERWNDIIVPVPSADEQNHIIAILTRLESLCMSMSAGLPAEIKAREKQYAYYRDKLLDFPAIQS